MAEADDIIAADAAWAQRFRNSTSNLAQRSRYEDSIAAAKDMEEQQGQAALNRRLETDPGARSLFLGRERLRQGQERIGQAERKMQQGQINFERGQERLLTKDIFDTEMKLRKAELEELNAQRLMRKELFDTDNAKRMLQQTTRVEQNISDHIANGILPGSKDYAERALRAIAQNPMIDPKARASILGSAKILGDEEEFDTAWNKLTPEQQKRATVVDDPKGWRISVAPEKSSATSDPAKRLETLRKEYDAVAKTRASLEAEEVGKLRPGFSEDDRAFYDDEKRRIMAEMKSLQGTGQPPATQTTAPAAAPAANASKPATVRQNGIVYTLQPDGSYK